MITLFFKLRRVNRFGQFLFERRFERQNPRSLCSAIYTVHPFFFYSFFTIFPQIRVNLQSVFCTGKTFTI